MDSQSANRLRAKFSPRAAPGTAPRVTVTCAECGKVVERLAREVSRFKKTYCSRACLYLSFRKYHPADSLTAYKDQARKAQKRRMADPSYKAKRLAYQREWIHKKLLDPEYRRRFNEMHRESQRRQRARRKAKLSTGSSKKPAA